MSEEFDIYSDLLGLEPGHRPPDYYSLLGVPPFEPDAGRINDATRDRVAQLTAHLGGPRSAEVQQLLGEIATARAALTMPVVKERYDARLRELRSEASEKRTSSASADIDTLLPPRAGAPSILQETIAGDRADVAPDDDPEERPRLSPWAQTVGAPPPPPPQAPAARPAIITARLVSGPTSAPAANPPAAEILDELPPAAFSWTDTAREPAESLHEPRLEPMFDARRSTKRVRTKDRRHSEGVILLSCVAVALGALISSALYWRHRMQVAEQTQLAAAPQVVDSLPRRNAQAEVANGSSVVPPKRIEPEPAMPRVPETPPQQESQAAPAMPREGGMAAKPAENPPATAAPAAPVAIDPARLKAFDKTLADARRAIARRELEAAADLLDLALLDASTDELQDRVEGVRTLRHYVDRFWNAVRESLKTLESGNEIVVNGEPAVLVEISPDRNMLVIRSRGENRPYETKHLPSNIAVALAESWLAADDVNSKAFIGAFLTLDERGDKQRGRRLLEEAKSAGSDAAAAVIKELDR